MSNEAPPESSHMPGQTERVLNAIKGVGWLTLPELHKLTNDPVPSISAQLRHLRKPEFGSHTILKRRRGRSEMGLFEYKMFDGEPGEPESVA